MMPAAHNLVYAFNDNKEKFTNEDMMDIAVQHRNMVGKTLKSKGIKV